MSELSKARIPDAPAIQRLPLLQLILVGLQHVLLMYGGAIAVPLIIGQAAGLSREEIAFLINADLLVAGIATIVQSLGIGPMGIPMPVMMGASFAAVGSMVAMPACPVSVCRHLRCNNRRRILRHDHRAVHVQGRTFLPAAGDGHRHHLDRFIAVPVAVNWAGGGVDAEQFGSPIYLAIAALVLAPSCWFHASCAVLGEHFRADRHVLRLLLCGAIGMVDLSGMAAAPWVQFVTPLHFGMPKFELAPILSMCLVVVIIFVESTGSSSRWARSPARKSARACCVAVCVCDAAPRSSPDSQHLHPLLLRAEHRPGADDRRALPFGHHRCRRFTDRLEPAAQGRVFGSVDSSSGTRRCSDCDVRHGCCDRIKILQEADIGDRRNQLLVAVSIGMGLIPWCVRSFRTPADVDEPDHPQRHRHGNAQRADAESAVQHSRRRRARGDQRLQRALALTATPKNPCSSEPARDRGMTFNTPVD